MRKLRKRRTILIIAAAVGALLLLSGCGSFQTEKPPQGREASLEQSAEETASPHEALVLDADPSERDEAPETPRSTEVSTVPEERGEQEETPEYFIPRLETRYFLKNLSGQELEFCELVYASALSLSESVSVPAGMELSFEQADRLVSLVFYDCPELIMCSGGYSIHGAQYVSRVKLVYRMDEAEYKRQRAELEAVLSEYEAACAGLSDYDAELYVHDKICESCVYSTSSAYADSAYGALVSGSALCQGYTKAFQLVMQRLGYVCLFVSSEKMLHSWNLISLGGVYYQIDLTWDDSGDCVNYAYFNIDDERSAAFDHVYDMEEGLSYPACDSLALNYYILNGTYIGRETDLKAMLLAELDRMYASGGGEVELMFEDAEDLRRMIAEQGDWIKEWNADKYLTICFTRTIIEKNDHVYIARFEFSEE